MTRRMDCFTNVLQKGLCSTTVGTSTGNRVDRILEPLNKLRLGEIIKWVIRLSASRSGLPLLLTGRVVIEYVPDRAQTFEIAWFTGIFLEIFAQAHDEIVDRSTRDVAGIPPSDLEEDGA